MNLRAILAGFTAASGAASLSLAGCGGKVAVDGAGGATSSSTSTSTGVGATTTSSSTGSSSGSATSSSSSSSSGSSGSGCPATPPLSGPCKPGAACSAAGSVCLAHVSQSASSTLSFRMSEIAFAKPPALTTGIVASVFEGNTLPFDPQCNLEGAGTLSWLLQFDLAAGTLRTGGAKPSIDPAGPYAFVDQMVDVGGSTFHVQPATLAAPLSATCGFDSSKGDVDLPIYLDAGATQLVLMPLHALRLHDGTLSADRGCIGRYDSAGLDPANSCFADTANPTFLPGAALDAFISLEEADLVVIAALQQTFCVLLSGNIAMYGEKNAQGLTVCKRDANKQIVFKGDWCGAADQPASSACADAVQVTAKFAAQAVKIP